MAGPLKTTLSPRLRLGKTPVRPHACAVQGSEVDKPQLLVNGKVVTQT